MDQLLDFAGKATIVYFGIFFIFYLSDKRRIFNGVLLTFGLFLILGDLTILALNTQNSFWLLAGIGIFLFTLFLFPIGCGFVDAFAAAMGKGRRQRSAQPVADLRSGVSARLVRYPHGTLALPIAALDS